VFLLFLLDEFSPPTTPLPLVRSLDASLFLREDDAEGSIGPGMAMATVEVRAALE